MASKRQERLRRAKRSRMHIRELKVPRLCVFRSPRHIYAQVISADGGKVEVSASSLDKDFEGESSANMSGATAVGKLIATRALDAGFSEVAFDRSGYKYHGRIKALADAAREGGLQF